MSTEYTASHRRLYDRLRQDCVDGTYRPGERLPSERDLAERYGVGRQVIRQALRLLQQDGLIQTRRGSGSYLRHAAGSRRRAKRVLGIIVPNLSLSDGAIATGAIHWARESNLATLVDVHDDESEGFHGALRAMVEQQVAAILLILPRDFGRFNPEPIEAAGIPYVLVRRDDPDLICDKVVIDNVAVGEMATRALLSHGCRQPVFLGPLDYGTAWNRLRGFRQALRAAGIAYRAEDVLDTSRSELPPHEQVAPCVEQLISEQRPFDGICAFNDTHAANAVDVLVAHGIGVPGCVAVTGADDREFASRAVVPLTTIRFNAVQAGRDAAEMAMRRTEQPGERPRVVPIEAELVVRLSCPVPGSVQCDGMVG